MKAKHKKITVDVCDKVTSALILLGHFNVLTWGQVDQAKRRFDKMIDAQNAQQKKDPTP